MWDGNGHILLSRSQLKTISVILVRDFERANTRQWGRSSDRGNLSTIKTTG